MKIQATVTINAPVEKVFDAFTNLDTITDSVTDIIELEILKGPAKMALGTTWKETRVVFGKEATETMSVTGIEKNKSYKVEAASHGTKYLSIYTFEEKDGGTLVNFEFTGTPVTIGAKLMSPMAFFFRKSLKELMTKDMTDLKKVLES